MHLSKNQRKFAQRRQVGTWKWLKEGRCQESIGIEGVDLSETTGEPKKTGQKIVPPRTCRGSQKKTHVSRLPFRLMLRNNGAVFLVEFCSLILEQNWKFFAV